VHVFALCSLVFEAEAGVEVGELDGFHGVAVDLEGEGSESFDVDALN
jgi:hypothetical protein